MTELKLQIIVGSTRQARFSEKPARYLFDELKLRPNVDAELVDLRDWPLPFFDLPISPARANGKYGHELVEAWARKIASADGYVMVTPEYNHGYPAVLKNATDWTFAEWNHKPMSFVGWGNVGGARAIEQLRLVAVELEVAPLRHAVHILPDVMIAARQTDRDDLSVFAPLVPRLDLLADDLEWWMGALTPARVASAAG